MSLIEFKTLSVYVYKLKTLDPKGFFHEYSGHVTLIH